MRRKSWLPLFFTGLLMLSALPLSADWQIDVTFPDWKGSANPNLLVNSVTCFYGNSGQGTLFVTPSDSCRAFTLYVNNRKVNTFSCRSGVTTAVDIAKYTRDGSNSLQVSGIEPPGSATVQVCLPYPMLQTGKENRAQTFKKAGISEKAFSLIESIISQDIAHGFPAAQLAVVKNGQLVYSKAWGSVQTYDAAGNLLPAGSAAAVTRDTLFDLASNTKMYSVNYALQYLVSKGAISLDDKICDILGNRFAEDTIDLHYQVGGRSPIPLEENKALKAKLTIRDLLQHEGGFPASMHFYNDNYNASRLMAAPGKENLLYAGAGADQETRERTFSALCKTPLLYRTGSETLYSDLDYITLCFVIEKASGMPLDDFLKMVFWEPLGLEHISYRPLENGFTKADCAATELAGNTRKGTISYTGVRSDVIQGQVHDELAYYNMAGVSGHAGLFSNAEDLAKLAFIMLSGGYGYERYFSPEVLDMFAAPKDLDATDWGLGWWRQGNHGTDRNFGSTTAPETIGHQGFTGTLTLIDRKENLVIVLLTNKIHSPLIPGGEKQNKFAGNYYLTGSLGFTSQIINLGLQATKDLPQVYRALLGDAVQDAKNRAQAEGISLTDSSHPYICALQALEAVKP